MRRAEQWTHLLEPPWQTARRAWWEFCFWRSLLLRQLHISPPANIQFCQKMPGEKAPTSYLEDSVHGGVDHLTTWARGERLGDLAQLERLDTRLGTWGNWKRGRYGLRWRHTAQLRVRERRDLAGNLKIIVVIIIIQQTLQAQWRWALSWSYMMSNFLERNY